MWFTSSENKFVVVSAKQREIHLKMDSIYECIKISHGTNKSL